MRGQNTARESQGRKINMGIFTSFYGLSPEHNPGTWFEKTSIPALLKNTELKTPIKQYSNCPKDRKCSSCCNGFSNKAPPSFPGSPQDTPDLHPGSVPSWWHWCGEPQALPRTANTHQTVCAARGGEDGTTSRNGTKLPQEMHWRWGPTPELLHQTLPSNHSGAGTEPQQLHPVPPAEAPSKAQIRFRCSKSPLADWLLLPLSLGTTGGWHSQLCRLRDVTFPYDIWFSELLSHPLVPKYTFTVPEKPIWTAENNFSFLKGGSLHSYPTFCYCHRDQNTYIDHRFLEFDVQPVVGEGNDGILCSPHVLRALPVELNERHLQRAAKFSSHTPPPKNLPLLQHRACWGFSPVTAAKEEQQVRLALRLIAAFFLNDPLFYVTFPEW